jgi:hypothetical protein
VEIFGITIQPTATCGDIISAFSLAVSTAALIYAICVGRSAVKDHRRQRYLDTRADVAGKALVEVNKLTNFLAHMTLEKPEETNEAREGRWAPIQELKQSFRIAQLHVDAHLGKLESDAMMQVWLTYVNLQRKQAYYDFSNRDDPDYEPMHDTTYGEIAERTIQGLRQRLEVMLQPQARHEEYKGPGWFERWQERIRENR